MLPRLLRRPICQRTEKSVVSKKSHLSASTQVSRSGTHVFDEVIRGYDLHPRTTMILYIQEDPSGVSVAYLVLYVDDILLIGNDVKMLGDIKHDCLTQFSMKDMGEASYILGIKIYKG
ncbi:UNVERIFIED_CONTAM: hypothetical protein Slati_3091100 [Sesamum latifolium]|uniref:Reverse transcriptase Ty1/copia-type domain-containing protein n=1 Tax=Sesamum latifolium TaxID=2727402 RepID=A0AAW2UV65_9LAMI